MKTKKIILLFAIIISINFNLSAWTSSNEGVCYAMDTLTILSPYISYNSSTGMYELNTHITILENDTLKIKPGEILKFIKETYPFYGIKIYGCLLAIGSKDTLITLGDPDYNISNGFIWNGIQFYNTSHNGGSILKYCIFRGASYQNYAPGYESTIYCENSSPIIDHCRICYIISGEETGGGSGISCEGQSYPIISNCTFDNLYNSIAIWCSPWNPYQDTINYPSPLIFNCNIHKSVSGFWFSPLNYDIVVYRGGFLDNCYLGVPFSNIPDTTLGTPVDTVGDGICNTTSTNGFKRFMDVDGVVNPRGDTLLTGIDENEIEILPTTSKHLSLKNNYPNPFEHYTNIEFSIKKREFAVNLIVLDSKGNIVKSLIKNQLLSPGDYQLKWLGDNDTGQKVPDGIYFYKLNAGKNLIVKKAILVKS